MEVGWMVHDREGKLRPLTAEDIDYLVVAGKALYNEFKKGGKYYELLDRLRFYAVETARAQNLSVIDSSILLLYVVRTLLREEGLSFDWGGEK